MVTESPVYVDQVEWEVLQRPGGGAWLRIRTLPDRKDPHNGSSYILDLPKAMREAMIADLMGTAP